MNKKTAKFTIDTLVEMLSRVGKPVKPGDQLTPSSSQDGKVPSGRGAI